MKQCKTRTNCRWLAFLLVGAVSLTTVTAQQPRKADTDHIKRKWLDLEYATSSQAQKLDVYIPDEGGGPFPVILHIHGGGWIGGDKANAQLSSMLRGLDRGYAVVAVNYRLSGEAIWPAQINDCKAAIRWVRAHADQYLLDRDRIAAWGSSAGGHLSALVGTSGDVEALEDLSQGNPEASSRVQAVVDWFGPTDFLMMDEYLTASGVKKPMIHSIPDSPESKLIGKNIEDAPELVRAANPETYISADDPPFLIQHGLEDNLVPYQGSVLLARKLGWVLGYEKVSLELFPDTRHGGPAFGSELNLERVYRFLDKHLKEQ
jgi:acetyl esterase/lipase